MHCVLPLLLSVRSPDVSFCGYTVPHPLENKMNIRLQTFGAPATAVFRKALDQLNSINVHMLSVFEEAATEYEQRKSQEPKEQ